MCATKGMHMSMHVCLCSTDLCHIFLREAWCHALSEVATGEGVSSEGAGEHAAAQRAVGKKSNPQLPARRDKIILRQPSKGMTYTVHCSAREHVLHHDQLQLQMQLCSFAALVFACVLPLSVRKHSHILISCS